MNEIEKKAMRMRALINRLSIEHEINLTQAEMVVTGAWISKVLGMQASQEDPMRLIEALVGALTVSRMVEKLVYLALVEISGLSQAKFNSVMKGVVEQIKEIV